MESWNRRNENENNLELREKSLKPSKIDKIDENLNFNEISTENLKM